MSERLVMQDDGSRRKHAASDGLHDHLHLTAEARRLQAEAIAEAVHWGWMKSRRAFGRLATGLARLKNERPGEQQATADVERIAAHGRMGAAAVGDRPLGLIRRLILEPYASWRRRSIAIDQLRSLDDRVLADIGLRRSEIGLAVDGLLQRRGERLPRVVEPRVPAEEARQELPLAA